MDAQGLSRAGWGCVMMVGTVGGLTAICVANGDIRNYPELAWKEKDIKIDSYQYCYRWLPIFILFKRRKVSLGSERKSMEVGTSSLVGSSVTGLELLPYLMNACGTPKKFEAS